MYRDLTGPSLPDYHFWKFVSVSRPSTTSREPQGSLVVCLTLGSSFKGPGGGGGSPQGLFGPSVPTRLLICTQRRSSGVRDSRPLADG